MLLLRGFDSNRVKFWSYSALISIDAKFSLKY